MELVEKAEITFKNHTASKKEGHCMNKHLQSSFQDWLKDKNIDEAVRCRLVESIVQRTVDDCVKQLQDELNEAATGFVYKIDCGVDADVEIDEVDPDKYGLIPHEQDEVECETPLADLDICSKTHNILQVYGINTIEKLCAKTFDEIKKIPGFGGKSKAPMEIVEALRCENLSLKSDIW